MAKLLLVRQDTGPITSEDRSYVAAFLRRVSGLGEKGQKQVERFLYGLLDLEPGEMVEVETRKERVGWFHRKHMAFESAVFDAQEVIPDFDQFRDWLKIGAGHCDYYAGANGMVAIPRSISYAKLEEDEMREFDDNCVRFLRERGCETLWPGLRRVQQVNAIEQILQAFNK